MDRCSSTERRRGRCNGAGMRGESGAVTGDNSGSSVVIHSSGRGTISGSLWRRYEEEIRVEDDIETALNGHLNKAMEGDDDNEGESGGVSGGH